MITKIVVCVVVLFSMSGSVYAAANCTDVPTAGALKNALIAAVTLVDPVIAVGGGSAGGLFGGARMWGATVNRDGEICSYSTSTSDPSQVWPGSQAIAKAKVEIARRGLAATVTKAYYTLLAGQRKYATAQQALDQARQSMDISERLERGGEVAHSDVVKSQLQYAAQEQAFRESKFTMDTARLDLAVLLFRDFDQNFGVVDDLNLVPAVPAFAEVQTMAERENPDLQAANATLRAARLDVQIARQAFLPSLTADFAWGIEANAFALHSTVAAFPDAGKLPNLGYFLTVSLNVPVWDWGSKSSKVRQAAFKREQANVDLTATQRTLIRNLQGFYQEAQTAREQVESLRRSVDLAAESLRLNGLRYQAGEATILELVDAQTTLILARNAYDDGQVRYRLAVANLQTLTGTF
jgi:outer membrane protein TolC